MPPEQTESTPIRHRNSLNAARPPFRDIIQSVFKNRFYLSKLFFIIPVSKADLYNFKIYLYASICTPHPVRCEIVFFKFLKLLQFFKNTVIFHRKFFPYFSFCRIKHKTFDMRNTFDYFFVRNTAVPVLSK